MTTPSLTQHDAAASSTSVFAEAVESTTLQTKNHGISEGEQKGPEVCIARCDTTPKSGLN